MTAAPRGRAEEFGRFLEIQNLGLNLPFALAFFLTASAGRPSPWVLLWIVLAFVGARNAGHAFNRIVDAEYDRKNPRTRGRALVTGRYSRAFAALVVAGSSAMLLVAAALLNPLALALAPVALAVLFAYSYSKRFTATSTVFLGLVEGIIPAAVYIGVQGQLPVAAVGAVVGLIAWGTAFETIHSLGDVEADRAAGLRSIPVRLGTKRASELIPGFHAAALVGFVGFGWLARMSLPFYLALAAMAAVVMVIDRDVLRAPDRPTRPFRLHMLLGALFLIGTLAALYLPGGNL